MSRLGVAFMRLLSHLPLAWVRALGWGLGWLLYGLAVPRRRVVQINLALCFPRWTAARRQALVPKVFIHFAQAWLDRSWLWHGRPEVTRQRLGLTGALAELQGSAPTVIFAPHFVGLDAGWTALTQQLPRRFTTIYTDQANKVVDAWIHAGRSRFGTGMLAFVVLRLLQGVIVARHERGVDTVVRSRNVVRTGATGLTVQFFLQVDDFADVAMTRCDCLVHLCFGQFAGEAMGRILAGGVRDMADWVNKLYGQAFAAVYVQPGAKVAVHLEQPLDIDYDAKGRRVHHRTGEAHASDLD